MSHENKYGSLIVRSNYYTGDTSLTIVDNEETVLINIDLDLEDCTQISKFLLNGFKDTVHRVLITAKIDPPEGSDDKCVLQLILNRNTDNDLLSLDIQIDITNKLGLKVKYHILKKDIGESYLWTLLKALIPVCKPINTKLDEIEDEQVRANTEFLMNIDTIIYIDSDIPILITDASHLDWSQLS